MKRIAVVAVILAVSSVAFAVPVTGGAPFDAKVRAIIGASKLKASDMAVTAISLPKNKALADINTDEPLNPASCMKLITTAVALRTLGPDYQFPTDFFIVQGEGANDLYVKGYGDPALVIERLEEMVPQLVRSGIPVGIRDIIVDGSFFDEGDFPGRQKGSSRSYNAMVSAVALNHAAITVEVFPGEKVGSPASVFIDVPGMRVQNMAKTGPARTKRGIRISKSLTDSGEVVKITGRIPLNGGQVKQYFNVTDPNAHFGNALRELLEEKGVSVKGRVKSGTVPKGAKLIFQAKSPLLSDVIKDMNKNSSNFMAEEMTKAVGAKAYGAPGTTEKGANAYAKYLKSLGAKDFLIENGSGLSYRNRISANDMLAVMKDIYNDKALRDIFIDSLSVAGSDGTIKKWDSPVLEGRLKAKTGSLNGVSTLSGFMPKGQEMILFSIMFNGRGVDFWTGRHTAQRIVEALIE